MKAKEYIDKSSDLYYKKKEVEKQEKELRDKLIYQIEEIITDEEIINLSEPITIRKIGEYTTTIVKLSISTEYSNLKIGWVYSPVRDEYVYLSNMSFHSLISILTQLEKQIV